MNVFFSQFFAVFAEPMAFFGILGQLCFTSRFVVQWIVSEKEKKSTIPLAFWYFSILGALTTLTYALWRRDPIFTIAQMCGLVVYVRNLVLIQRGKREGVAA